MKSTVGLQRVTRSKQKRGSAIGNTHTLTLIYCFMILQDEPQLLHSFKVWTASIDNFSLTFAEY